MSSTSRHTTQSPRPSSRPLVPPINPTSGKDQQFLSDLNKHINLELSTIDEGNPEQRYIVYKAAFDRIIDYVSAYKPLLTAVKAEYEDCIDTIQRGHREAFYLSGKLKALATEPSTVHNYRKRADDLENKISTIAVDNARLRAQLRMLREDRMEKDKKIMEEHTPTPKEVKKDKRHIPGLTLEQSTNVATLTKELEKVEKQLKELNISYKTRFSPKDIRDTLKEHLSKKVNLRDQLQEQAPIKKQRRLKLKVAVEAAQAYTKIQPPHQSIGEAVVSALARAGSQVLEKEESSNLPRSTTSTSFVEDDPTQEKESELMLEYIEKFNELVEDAKYEEAAVHAANSPKGILRTPETMHRFKELQGELTSSGRSCLLAFCEALMATVPAYPAKPSDFLSEASVKCALDENRLDLVSHWLSQDRLTLTELLGDSIVEFGKAHPHVMKQCLSLAQPVYIDVKSHIAAMCCMVKQGRVGQGLEYAQKVGLSCAECAEVLASLPSLQLALGMFEKKVAGKRLMPMGQVAFTLIKDEADLLGVQFIRHLQQNCENLPDQDQKFPSPLRNSVFEDEMTTEEQWYDVVKACQDNGYHDCSIDILAAVTVIMAVRKATRYVEDMERQRLEEEKRKQQLAAAGGKKKEKKKKKRRQVQMVEIHAENHTNDAEHEAEVVRFGTVSHQGQSEEEEEEE